MRRSTLSAAALALSLLLAPAAMAQLDVDRVEPGWLGVVLSDEGSGALVERLVPGSPAGDAGIIPGMRVVGIGDTPIADVAELIALIGSTPAGTIVQVHIDGHDEPIGVVLGVRSGDPSAIPRGMIGETLPDLTVVDHRTGASVPVFEPGAPVTIVEFWATWCGPCRAAIPDMQALHARLGDDVRVIALTDETADEVGDVPDELGMDWLVGRDVDGAVNDAMWVMSFPTWFIADAEGTIVEVVTGGGRVSRVEEAALAVLAADGSGDAAP